MHRFQDAGLEEDDFESTIESLTVLSECYQKPSDVIWSFVNTKKVWF